MYSHKRIEIDFQCNLKKSFFVLIRKQSTKVCQEFIIYLLKYYSRQHYIKKAACESQLEILLISH